MAAAYDMSSASLYTDFGGLAQLRAKASSHAAEANGNNNNNRADATKEVARQFEALFLQTMLKTMRDASQLSESTDSDQTRFYQDMFDKQVALDLATKGEGTGLGEMLERELSGAPVSQTQAPVKALLQQQIAMAAQAKEDN